jgi:hypothetical protein
MRGPMNRELARGSPWRVYVNFDIIFSVLRHQFRCRARQELTGNVWYGDVDFPEVYFTLSRVSEKAFPFFHGQLFNFIVRNGNTIGPLGVSLLSLTNQLALR